MAEGGEIIEGFLCPICKADLGSPKSLETHFQEEHTEDQDVIKSIKGLLGKAKKKILKLEDEELPADFRPTAHFEDGFEVLLYEPQEIGAFRSHTEYFRIFRGARLERYAAETNKLLIRLDKLLRDLPADPMKRKLHEQAIVPWIDDRDVKLCPNCAKSFHVARRKHHCRLCGAIMCNECSHFLELGVAKKMTGSGFGHDLSCTAVSLDKQKNANSGALEHSSSTTSLSSVKSFVDNMTGDQNLRLCVHCKQLLETREKLKENRSQKPIISQFYERLASYIKEADEMAEVYFKMCESLQFGETSHTAEEAQVLRAKLLKLAENIDSLSKKITILGTKDVENPPKGVTGTDSCTGIRDMAEVFNFMIDPDEDISLHEAVLKNDFEKMVYLLNEKPSRLNETMGAVGVTPLRCAAAVGSAVCVRELLKRGAEVDVIDIKAQTPLFVAVYNSHTEVCRLLLEAGADPDGSRENLSSPLQIACQNGFSAGLKLLLEYGAALEGYPVHPLHIAASHDHLGCFFLLLLYGSRTDLESYSLRHHSLAHAIVVRRLPPIYIYLWLLFGGKVDDATRALMQEVEDYRALVEFIGRPLSLKNQCRIAIRKRMKCCNMQHVTTLGIPEVLAEFLLYKDIPNVAGIHDHVSWL